MNGSNGGNGDNQNQLGGFGGGGLGSAALPAQGADDSDQIDTPDVGKIPRGETPIHTAHAYNKAVYNKTLSAGRMIDHLRTEMDKLTDMGDTVTPEDVIAGAGRLVGQGVPARELASILSEMPTQAGQGLAAWVLQNDRLLTQQEALITRQTDMAAHRMAQSALQVIATEHLMGHARNLRAAMPNQGQLAPGQQKAIKQNPMGPVGPAAGASSMPQPQIVEMMGQGGQGQGGGG